jgi:3-dehydroquinate dehydratase/shikimate dehydrogenase
MTEMCVSLMRETTDELMRSLRALPPEVGLAEVRLDAMSEFDLERIIGGADRPLIITCRPEREGGRTRMAEDDRLDKLRRAARLGADYVDVELDSVDRLGELPGTAQKIVSYHDFERTPDELEGIFRRIRHSGADVVKLAVRAEEIGDTARVLQLLRRHAGEVPTIALAMGEEGLASRVLAGKFGAFLTFACESDDRRAAPGQIDVAQMLQMYRFPAIDADTEVYGVIANPVAHSMSPAIHNAAFQAIGRNAVYLPLKVDDPARFFNAFEPLGLRGASVTIPHKETVRQLMDAVDELSAGIGAVNTVLIHDGQRSGRNTDVAAALSAIQDAAERANMHTLENRDVLVVGAGGAGRAIAYGLTTRGATVTIANRTVSRAEQLAAELGARACGLDEMRALAPEILVNATCIGMWPEVDRSPVPAAMLRSGMVVFDSVYNPVQTRLLREAEQAGCVTASGLDWFVRQAVAQFEWWTNQEAPRKVMERVVRDRLEGQ